MQIQAENFEFFANLINHAKSILILVQKNPEIDTLAAALFLENTLTALGKKVCVVASGKIPENFDQPSRRLKSKIEPKKLVVSFNWRKNAVEKVGYNLEGENFNFIVSPRNSSIQKDEIKIFYKGDEADLVITLGVTSLSNLDYHEREYLKNKEIVNIDRGSDNQLFGKLNFVNENADSVCRMGGKLIENNQFTSTPQAADYLLTGLRSATEGFNSVSDPATFEAAAFCAKIKNGEVGRQKKQEYLKSTQVPKDWLSPKIFKSKQAS
jgi:nanoRNase/pAp phosphatase (c-di-AMP/oligoRNAs hydrolase)